VAASLAVAACAAPEAATRPEPVALSLPAEQPAIRRDVPPPAPSPEEARALLAQAETDIQRARARRALWSKAWESLLAARAFSAAGDHAETIRQAKRASQLAELGLEQLSYPAVR